MIDTTDTTGYLSDIIIKETKLIDRFSAIQASIMESVITNNWETLSLELNQVKKLSCSIEKLDQKRDSILEELRVATGEKSGTHLYRITRPLELEQRGRLNELYRKLKLSVLNLQTMNWRIHDYIGTVTGIMRETLKEIYPNRRGSLYSKTGSLKEVQSNPMVLNKKL